MMFRVVVFVSTGFAMNVIALLPYLVEHFEEPNTTCSEVAEHIAQVPKLLQFSYSKF